MPRMFTESEIKLGSGVVGTLAIPESNSKKIVFLIHGVGGHRDYCYQKMLGQALAEKCDLATWRYDSRGCGESDNIEYPPNGRSVGGTDYADLDNSYRHFVGLGYQVYAIVGHSRGASIMFLWALRNPQIFVPYLINCSGRFHTPMYRERVYAEQPHYQRDQGYSLVARRYGKYVPTWIPMQEVDEFCSWDSYKYGNINPQTQVLTFFGNLDHHVPPSDSGYWANLFAGRHTLRVIIGGDHNFYAGRDKNGKKINLNPQVVDYAVEWLRPKALSDRFYNVTKTVKIPRWPTVEGVENFRDFGGYGKVKSGLLFRSARLDAITETGKKQLAALGIKHVFDFRSIDEATKTVEIPGVRIVQAPVFKNRDMSPAALAQRYAPMLGTDDVRGFEHSYMEILGAGKPVFRNIIETMRKHPGEGILVHCSAGKDRTGIFCAILLNALGVDDYTVCREYELTTIGWKEHRKVIAAELAAKLRKSGVGQANIDHMLSSKFESMMGSLELMRKEYKDGYHYFLKCGVSPDDLSQVLTGLTRQSL